MLQKEIIESINKYGNIFRYHFFNGNDIALNYSDFLQLLRTERNYWKRVDTQNNIENGYSVTYDELIKSLEQLVHCEDESIYQSHEKTIQYAFSLIKQDGFRIGKENIIYNSMRININMCPSRSAVNYKLTNAYKELVGSDSERVFNMVLSLYESRQSIVQLLSNSRESDEYKGAIYYLGLETKNIKRTTEKDNKKEELNELSSRYDELKRRAEDFENDINLYSSEFKDNEEEWLKNQDEALTQFRDEHEKKLHELESTYDEKLKLSEPVKFWKDQAEIRKKQFCSSFLIVTFLTILVLTSGGILVELLYKYTIHNDTISRLIPLSFVIIGIITLLMYLLSVAIKMMLSAKHLQTVYEQKSIFTYFFLTMIKEDRDHIPISEDEKSLVYQTLFSSPDTGLLKNGNDGSDITSLLNTIFSRMAKGN